MNTANQAFKDYERIRTLLHYIEDNSDQQPELQHLADIVQLSPHHLQKLFKRWAGVSPKQYLKLATLKKAKQYLRQNNSILEAAFKSGLSSSSRLYDHFVSLEGTTPGEFKAEGKDLSFEYSEADSPYGRIFICWTKKGLHILRFCDTEKNLLADLIQQWPNAHFSASPQKAQSLADTIFRKKETAIKLSPIGSPFQLHVWQALLSIPAGHCCSYGDLATLIQKPKAARAVGSAVAANPLAILIPCHRVIQASGTIGSYRWGEERKRILLSQEFFNFNPEQTEVLNSSG